MYSMGWEGAHIKFSLGALVLVYRLVEGETFTRNKLICAVGIALFPPVFLQWIYNRSSAYLPLDLR